VLAGVWKLHNGLFSLVNARFTTYVDHIQAEVKIRIVMSMIHYIVQYLYAKSWWIYSMIKQSARAVLVPINLYFGESHKLQTTGASYRRFWSEYSNRITVQQTALFRNPRILGALVSRIAVRPAEIFLQYSGNVRVYALSAWYTALDSYYVTNTWMNY